MTALPRPAEAMTDDELIDWFHAQPYLDRQPPDVTTIELPGEPMPAARWKTTSNNGKQFKRYLAQCRDYRDWAIPQMCSQRYFDAGCRLAVEIRINRKSHVKADVDNLFKAITDPLNGFVYDDDSQIDEAHVYIRRGVGLENAGVVLKVWERQQASAQVARPRRLRLRGYTPGRHLRVG